MHPELFTLPGGLTIKTYGFFLMIGFLSAVWLAMRRAAKVKADPDTVLDLSFLSLLFGVIGARAFYVIHYWNTQFADASNKFVAVINITQGGLEFLGGFLGAVAAVIVCCWWKQVSLRLYMDILAPSTMWGLAFGRIGCFFNGCCYGGLCLAGTGAAVAAPGHPWAVRFPYASPAHYREWEERAVTVPAELVVSVPNKLRPQPTLIPESKLFMPVEQRQAPFVKFKELSEELEAAKARNGDPAEIEKLEKRVAGAKEAMEEHQAELFPLLWAQRFPSRENPQRSTSVSELQQLAAQCRSLPVHPTQLYSAVHALLLALFLSALFYARKRHGVVMGAMLVLYPIPRAILEIIRADNPADVAGLTASQFVSLLCILPVGIAFLVYLYKKLPERSPLLAAGRTES